MKLNSDDNLPLNKTLELHNRTTVFRAGFHEGNKCYSQVFLDEYLYKKFLKTKKISYRDGVTDFHDEQIPKAGSNYTYLAVFNVNFVLKEGNYYP